MTLEGHFRKTFFIQRNHYNMIKKELLEIKTLQINQKLSQIESLIRLFHRFMNKVSSHLKVLVHMANDLVDNEDQVLIVDKFINDVHFNLEGGET